MIKISSPLNLSLITLALAAMPLSSAFAVSKA